LNTDREVARFVDDKLTIIVLANSHNAEPASISLGVAALYIPGLIPDRTVAKADPKIFDAYVECCPRPRRLKACVRSSMSISAEGPHLDLMGWRHFDSTWTRLVSLDAKRFRTLKSDQMEASRFPSTTKSEIIGALNLSGVIIQSSHSFTDYDAALVIALVNGKFKVVFSGGTSEILDLNADGVPEIFDSMWPDGDGHPKTTSIHVWNGKTYVPLMKLLVFIGFLMLGILSLRGVRWAYVTFVLLGLLYFPVSVGFRLNPQPCTLIPSIPLAIHSLTNYRHIVLFVLFFLMTSAQFRMSNWRGYAWAAVACLAMGLLVELAQGISGTGHCRMRDLIPDAAGIVLGAGIVFLWNTVRGKPRDT